MKPKTKRNEHVCEMYYDGHSQSDIARKLGVTRQTIHSIINRYYEKYKLSTDTDLSVD